GEAEGGDVGGPLEHQVRLVVGGVQGGDGNLEELQVLRVLGNVLEARLIRVDLGVQGDHPFLREEFQRPAPVRRIIGDGDDAALGQVLDVVDGLGVEGDDEVVYRLDRDEGGVVPLVERFHVGLVLGEVAISVAVVDDDVRGDVFGYFDEFDLISVLDSFSRRFDHVGHRRLHRGDLQGVSFRLVGGGVRAVIGGGCARAPREQHGSGCGSDETARGGYGKHKFHFSFLW